MIAERKEPHFIEDEQGAFTSSYGPFVLKSAFQPIFSQDEQGQLTIEACEALIRPFRGNQPVLPGEFFSLVDPIDALSVDTLCRQLHILNMGRMSRKNALLFVNFNPSLLTQGVNVANTVRRMIEACGQARLRPSRVVCEITEQDGNETTLMNLVETLRNNRFKIAVDDYGADDSDLQRVERIKPDFIKFDAAWVRRFSETPAGIALLRLMAEKFTKSGIDCVFEGLEEEYHLDLCEEIGVKLMQGYALARPAIAPTDFDTRFPEHQRSVSAHDKTNAVSANTASDQPAADDRCNGYDNLATKRTATFGRRQR